MTCLVALRGGQAPTASFTWRKGDVVVGSQAAYTLQNADIPGQSLRCQVLVRDLDGTTIEGEASFVVPVLTSVRLGLTTVAMGDPVLCIPTVSTVGGTPTVRTRWEVDGAVVATGTSWRIADPARHGRLLVCRVTATHPGGFVDEVVSTFTVRNTPPQVTTLLTWPLRGEPNLPMRCTTSLLDPDPEDVASATLSWLIDGVTVAVGPSVIVPPDALAAGAIECRVTAEDRQGGVTEVSVFTEIVAPPEQCASEPGEPRFVGNVLAGISPPWIPEEQENIGCGEVFAAGAAAAADIDDDGDVDLFLPRIEHGDQMLINDGRGRFVDRAVPLGLAYEGFSSSGTFVDVNADGRLDLWVTTMGPEGNRLYIAQGDGTFVDEALERGVRASLPGGCSNIYGASAGDVDGDGDLDVLTTQWHCQGCSGNGSRLYRNDGDGYFEDVTEGSGLDLTYHAAFTASFLDVDDDGDQDCFVAADWGESGLWLNDGTGSFENVTQQVGVGLDRNGMGSAIADIDDDGDLDWFVTAIHDERDPCPPGWDCDGSFFYRNLRLEDGSNVSGPLLFEDATDELGVRESGWGWGAEFFDIDNDGDLDLGHANGYPSDPKFALDRVRLLVQHGAGNFVDEACTLGVNVPGQTRALAPIDVDNDGDLDVVVTHMDESPLGLVNTAPTTNAWLKVRAREQGNPFGVGATILVRTTPDAKTKRRDITAASAYLGSRPLVAHFGLGSHDQPISEVVVRWPDGGEALLRDVMPRQDLLVDRDNPPTGTFDDDYDGGTCPEDRRARASDATVARQFIDLALGHIRKDLPNPPVHARTLHHLSVAMFDAWSTYDDVVDGIVDVRKVTEKPTDPEELEHAREISIAFAAYRVLTHRYGPERGGTTSVACFTDWMTQLGLDPADEHLEGADPVAVGNRVGFAVIQRFRNDGANEAQGYADTTGWTSSNPILSVDQPGLPFGVDPDVWQPLRIIIGESQNGIPLGEVRQTHIGAQWTRVQPFAITRDPLTGLYATNAAGLAPSVFDDDMGDWILDLLERGKELDINDDVIIDISPASRGNNTLGRDDGTGHTVNPATGTSYEPNLVRRGDFARVIAEYWADGPSSETPPGHWISLAGKVSDSLAPDELVPFGEGPPVDRLAWDALIYLTVSASTHDAAIVAWELKRVGLGPRPITLVRWMAEQGQRTETNAADYSPFGLPLQQGLVERITSSTTAPGQRHAALRGYEGEFAIFAWPGEPSDRVHQHAPLRWLRAAEWIPYQRKTFVTPAFPGFVSGHSTFSRAAAAALTAVTASPFFPGGMYEFVARAGEFLFFEDGPTQDIRLQMATYADAADQAGISRRFGGIHIMPDDHTGRIQGAMVGEKAVTLARRHWRGEVR